MNPRINQLVRTLLKKDTLEQCSLPELQEFADRHPYFGAAQLLLTKKMQTDKPDQYNEQLQKTFLFFHNPLWVEHLLDDNGKAEITVAQKEEPTRALEQIVTPEAESTIVMDPQPVPEVLIPGAPEEHMQVITNEEQQTEIPVIEATAPAEEIITESTDEKEEGTINVEANGGTNIPAAIPVEKPKEELLFEPFHTVDYFASQGIKLKDEEKPKDKFGQQLKSFTQWLKTMKRLPVTEIVRNTEPGAEKKVEEMAQHSLEEKEVVTEAMAEVWEKQGNSIKAIDIYTKLSLLEPAKSAYFAAKIVELKKLN